MGSEDQFRIDRRGPVQYAASAAIARLDFVLHAFCTRRGGVSSGSFADLNVSARDGDGEENIRKNLGVIASAFEIRTEQFCLVDQVHGNGVLVIDNPVMSHFHKIADLSYDAIVTDQPGVAIGIRTADCVPIFLVDTAKGLIGAVHAGWRGTALGVVSRTVDTLVSRFSSQPKDIIAAIGPAIGACCYEVDEKVYGAFGHRAGRGSFFHPRGGGKKWMLDMSLANIIQMEEKGVPRENVSRAALCTSCRRELFFSYRAERGHTGRQLNFLMLEGRPAVPEKVLDKKEGLI